MNTISPGRRRLLAGIAHVLNERYAAHRIAYSKAHGLPWERATHMRVG